MSEHPEQVGPSEAEPRAATRPASPTTASRQSLVVKPRSSNGPFLIFGAIASALAGFAVVFATGLGRTDPNTDMPDAREAAVNEPSTLRFFVPPDDERMDDIKASPPDQRHKNRFVATPVALEDSAGSEARSDESAPGLSKFSSSAPDAGSGDATDEPAALVVPADEAPSREQAAAPARSIDPPEALTPPAPTVTETTVTETTVPETTEPTTPPAPPATAVAAAAPEAESPPAPSSPAVPPRPKHDAPPTPGLRAPPLESTLAAALAPKQPPATQPAAAASAAPAGSPFEDPEAPIPVTPPGGVPAGPAVGRGVPDAGPSAEPRPDRLASADVTRGFGGAPVVTPPPTEPSPARSREPSVDVVPGSSSGAAVPGPVQADGRPGPIQLEGVQTPQLTIEKRGPREVQVGKVARYDMLVRNVGGVAAHDVTLRDRVPLGTKLVSTSPPAAPGEAGELVWSLGSLPQGGQARVAMELMPTEEGEVGSVASVSFRADASVRSVATRAGLAIEAADPKAVLVGSTVELAITVRNPGTGEATGVVLEGNVPTGFTHSSGSALEYDVGRLRPGESRRIDLKLVSTHPGVQTLKLSARADGRIETDHAVRLEVTAPTLELTANMPNRRYLQRPVTCVLSMNNAGTAPANTIELAAQLPPGMKFLRANNAGYYEESTHRVLWHLEQLPAAEVGSVEMVLVPTALGPQRIAAAARSNDGLAAQVAHTVEVEGLAALLFEVGDSEDPIEVDGITEYVVRVGNQGTKAATGVRVTATLLGDLEPVDAKGPAAHRIENLSILFEPLANLAPAQESVYRIRVRGRRAGDQRVQVQVTSDESRSPITKEEVTRVYADR